MHTRALADIFDQPLDPARSIQLNNRHWPGASFELLGLIGEAEHLVAQNELRAAARLLQRLRTCFRTERFFRSFLRRLHRLHSFRSQFGCERGRFEINQQVHAANRYAGGATRESYPLHSRERFAPLIDRTVAEYRRQYGRDVVRTHCSVRYAKPDERQVDVTAYGPLSDFHNDEYKGITTIVYLSKVDEQSGAFAFIRDSHLIPRSLVLTAAHQCVEFDMLLTTPQQLAALPLELRGSVGLGNFLEPEKVAAVMAFREVLEGDVGTYVMFNGQYLLHRGGKPLRGDRTAAFFAPVGLLRHRLKSVRSLMYCLTAR